MDYDENLQKLLKLINIKEENKKIVLKLRQNYKLLPFQNRDDRPPYDQGLIKIIGEFSRIIQNYELNEDISPTIIINEINNNDKIKTFENEEHFKLFIKELLFENDKNISILHPTMYKYTSKTPQKNKNSFPSRGEHQVALFFRDVFYQNNAELYDYFSKTDDIENNIIIKMIYESLPQLDNKEYKPMYIPKFKHIYELFKEDITFALKNKEFFDENLDNIFAYYYFYYSTQMTLKLFEFDSDLNKNEEIYYTLDNENINKNRRTVTKGYEFIKNNNEKLLFKMYTLDYINILLGTKGLLLSEIINHINNLNSSERQKFKEVFIEFIKIFISYSHSNTKIESDDIKYLINTLYNEFTEYENYKKESATRSRYPLTLEELGKHYFLKRRGRYRYVLNLKQDMILTITALCIKQDKIKLKSLFEEYEKRGIYLDYKSKKEVEKLLTKLNFIDKKSDSGDAQYVKSIL